MTGLVLELQRDALNKETSTDDLLRKALVVSRKLNLPEIIGWIESELGGYKPTNVDLEHQAGYRVVYGELKMKNPFHGWIPVNINDLELTETITKRFIAQPVSAIQDLIVSDEKQIVYKFHGVQAQSLMKMTGFDFEPALFISRQAIIANLDAVRNRVLDWALNLEASGILGEGMTFTKEEKIAAATQTIYSTVNNIGAMNHSQIQQNSSGSQSIVENSSVEQIANLVSSIESAIEIFKLSNEDKKELIAEVETLKIQIASRKPKATVLRLCLNSVKAILEGAGGNMLAAGLAVQIPQILSSMP